MASSFYDPQAAASVCRKNGTTTTTDSKTFAVEKDGLNIPLIDFEVFHSGDDEKRLETGRRIVNGFQEAGFVYLKNIPIPEWAVETTFKHSSQFFARPQDQKDILAWYSAKANRGYVAHGREKVTRADFAGNVDALRKAVPDLKESMEIGRDDEPDCPNMWPDEIDDEGKMFKSTMKEFWRACASLHQDIMKAVALGLGLKVDWFNEYIGQGDNTLRLLHYPEVDKSIFQREDGQLQVRAGEHSDYGSLTLLFQDSRGGLQVLSPEGTYVDAKPISGTVVVNAGDLLARWSNDTIQSTKHRVVEPPLQPRQENLTKYPARYSIAYFCNPDFDKLIETIPNTYNKTSERKYPPVKSGEYLEKRLKETYG
ncbi:hypothetical protein IWX49DRAFT_595772 [Phyllosticta citricarpa]|uniref:Fe2OG dioxygenase domain-containing protein n=2 Tax=Phyllosticta TaxID=121621 RepID=A0ABR1L1X8_9PEZI